MPLARRALLAGIAIAAVGTLVFVFRSPPVPVETAEADRGPLLVTVDEEGETRVRDRFVVAAPTAGRVQRIALDAGDAVETGAVVARLHPAPLDRRTRAAAEARIEAAQAHLAAAGAAVRSAEAAFAQAGRDARRMERLHAAGSAAEGQLERTLLEETTRRQGLLAARSAATAATHELEEARATLLAAEGGDGESRSACGGEACIELRAPVSGRILRVPEKSERVVGAGAPLLEIGDPSALEIVVDVLSPDAVRIQPGARMLLDRWGGDDVIAAHVRYVEPSGFRKISTLGVEEQRVNVIGDFDDHPEGLGDGFRVEARIVVFESTDVLRVPASALFRHGQGFAVFVVDGGRARRREIEIGERGSGFASVRSGLEAGERVVLHPSDRIGDGVRVREESDG